jgi:hypothetical protein
MICDDDDDDGNLADLKFKMKTTILNLTKPYVYIFLCVYVRLACYSISNKHIKD